MRPHHPGFVVALAAVLLLPATITFGETPDRHSPKTTVAGTVYDASTRLPIPHATVQVEGTGRSTLANAEGRYQIFVDRHEHRLKFSHIAYYSFRAQFEHTDSVVTLDALLQPTVIELGGITVYNVALDPGQRIITEAIKRKRDILSRVRDYRFDAYTKFVVRDESKPDSSAIWLLTETQSTSFWQQPDQYKEIITARRQSANIAAEDNLVTVGEILNFNRDRVEVGRYAIVSPTARDALDHYNYYLVDTVLVDSMRTFRLEIEPKNPDLPLFVGSIHIADSLYDVVDVNVGFSRGAEFPMIDSLRYRQRFARFHDDYWMPVEIRLSAEIAFGIPIPGIPRRLSFAHVASLHDYTFDTGHPKGFFDEFLIEVDDQADDIDSTAWLARQSIPLTDEEVRGYERLDSLKNLPVPIGKRLLQAVGAGFFVVMGVAPDFYRFNRVEGAYFGASETWRPLRRLDVRLTAGYGIRTERVQWGLGMTYRLHEGRRLDVGFDARDRIRRRPTILPGESYFSSGTALGWGVDAADYYRAEGFDAFIATKLVKFSRLRLTYHDDLHFSQPLGTNNTLFEIEEPVRDNPPIDDGKLRSLEAQLMIDNRPMFKRKGRAEILGATQYWLLTLGAEHASPDLIDNDFDFTRYYASLYRRQRTLGLGLTSIHLYAGAADGNLPPQRYYVIDYGDAVFFNTLGYNTLHESIFAGNRLYSISFDHNFRRYLFVRSGLPLIRDIPLWLSVHGSMFWSEFRNHTARPGDETLLTARKPYQELGFGIGNLTPFMMPFNFAINFTWQLSDYNTNDFTWYLELEL